MCANTSGETMWRASSFRLRLFHAGSMLWKTPGSSPGRTSQAQFRRRSSSRRPASSAGSDRSAKRSPRLEQELLDQHGRSRICKPPTHCDPPPLCPDLPGPRSDSPPPRSDTHRPIRRRNTWSALGRAASHRSRLPDAIASRHEQRPASHDEEGDALHDRSRSWRLLKVVLWLLGIAAALIVCDFAGFDLLGWFERLWDTMNDITIGYIVAGVTFQTIQTMLTALAWYYILAAGYPSGEFRYRDILAAYAAGVAMNGFLPANIGTLRVAPHVHGADPRLDLPGHPGRDDGAEDLLHRDRRGRLPLPLPHRARHVQPASSA